MHLPKISKHEIYSDITLLIAAALISTIALYVFDIHWSFYPGNQIFPPNKHVFTSLEPYYIGIPLGTIVWFVLLKLIFFAFVEEEKAIDDENGKRLSIKIKKGRAYMGK